MEPSRINYFNWKTKRKKRWLKHGLAVWPICFNAMFLYKPSKMLHGAMGINVSGDLKDNLFEALNHH